MQSPYVRGRVRLLALVFIGSLALSSLGCGAVNNGPHPDAASDARDAPADSAAPRCDPTKPFGPPALVPNINSAVRDQGAVLADELTLYFGSDRSGTAGLYVATRSSPASPFTDPVPLGTINAAGSASGPYLTGDELTMYYVFYAAGQTAGHIYVTRRADKHAEFPVGTAVAQINSTGDEEDPFVTADGAALYFGSARGGAVALDLYVAVRRSDGSFDTPQPLTNLNTTTTDGHPRVSQDGLTIYWSSPRTDGGAQGGTDIWTATRPSTAGSFGTPARVPALSSAANESPSWIAPDGCAIYLQSDRPGGDGSQDIYEAVKPM